ncbi:efflux transporter outer membrane subunit [Salinimicrobium sp. GXAS 041]|uniref:efflux transporter outer membrane subunit n=1 Tax=Salinimicrobium sp. GXAS 041 TaxID=3400806 RepID=UPI003C76EE7D
MKNSRIYKIVLVPAVLMSLQSCFVAKDYQRPEVVETESYRTDLLQEGNSSMADVSWRELFTDPLLTSYIEEALENNIDIRVALQQIEAAEAYVKQGKAAYFPTLNANAQVTHQELSRNSQFAALTGGSIDQFDLSANLSWEADIWGKIRSNDRAFQASYLQSVAAHQAVKTDLIADVASLYFQLLALDEQKRITLQTIENRENSLETTRALKEAGNLTEVGVKQTEAQLYRARAVLVDIENNIRLLENAMSILLGEAPHNIERTSLAVQDMNTDLNAGVPAQLLRNRPDVIAAEYNLINAFQLTNVARSEFYPSLRLSASGGFQALQLEDWINANSLFANVVGSLAQPIFNRRQIRTQYEVAEAQEEIAFLNFRRSLLIAAREVSDALYSHEAAVETIELKTKEFETYDLATSYSEELLNNGMANYLEVLTARENALNSRLELINAELNRLYSIVDLYQALGGGWE